MIKSLMKIFHLPTDTLRITLTPFSSRLNDQSIKEIRLRIARILNWAESEVLFPFLRAAQPTQIQRFSTNILLQDTTFLQETTFLQPSSIGRASNLTYTRLRITRTLNCAEGEVFDIFPRTAQPIQVRSSSTNIRPPYSLPQLAEHPVEHTYSRELRELSNWVEGEVLLFPSHCSADSNSKLFHEHTTSLQPFSIGRDPIEHTHD